MQCKSLTWRLKLIGRGVLYTALFTVSVAAAGNEYFVSTDGDDARNGRLVDQAFRTIQRGVDALEEGDTLTILPGEYFESVDRENLGGPDRETLIRAVIPGTVLLRGDVPIPPLEPVEGRPFVYATDFDRDVQIVNERDTLSMLTRAVNIADLEFLRGGFYHDSDAGRLYISTTHLAPPDFRAYTVSVLGTHGLYLERPQRVTIDGLAATGFNNAEIMATYPGYRGAWGIIIGRGLDCVIRNCTAFFNGGGIALFTGYTAHGREPGRGNVIEHGRAWANASRFISEGANIAAYSVNHDVIRDCEAYRAGRGIRLYGAIGPGTLKRSLAWDSSIQLKGGLLHRIGGAGLADRVVALRDAHVHDLTNSLVARGNAYHRGIETPRDNIRLAHEKEIDLGREFADPANRDYRLQDGSRFIGAAPDGSDRGPYPYEANIFFVRTDGDDAADGLSMEGAWRTPGHAARRLRPGDTLYLAPGAHRGGAEIETTEGDPVLIRGRGLEPVELTGAVHVRGPGSVEFERIRFSGPVTIAGGRDVVFRHCTFSEDDAPLTLSGTTGVRIEHGLFPAGGPSFQECSDIHLSGNVFEGTAQPVVVVDELAKVAYSDYNVYPAHARSAWRVGGRNIAASDLRPVHERYSRIGGKKYVTAGPFGRDAGPYRPPAESVLRVTPPVVHAVTDKTADIEWRTSERVDVTLTWSTVADGPDARRRERWPFGAYGFSTYSLTGLEPDTEYEFRLSYETPVRPAGTDEETEELTVAFRTAAMPREPVSWYVAPDGDDAADGRSREQALRTVNAAAARARAGDTVWIAGGTYTEIVQVRSTGTEGRPLTFRSVPGEKVVFDGRERSLPHAFMVTGKAHIHLDGIGRIPGWVPDPLLDETSMLLPPHETHSFWFTVTPRRGAAPGACTVKVVISPEQGKRRVQRIPVALYPVHIRPRQDFPVVQWFYVDALLDAYDCPGFNERFWKILEAYLRNIVEHGQDTAYVPVFTPPTDGVKRPSQLLRVFRRGKDAYRFDWRDVKRYVDLARRCGIRYFEWTHLFTQWGARYAIRIYRDQGRDEQLLWPADTPATAPLYRAFLAAYLLELQRFLEREGLMDRSFFHVSDEPHGDEHLENYRRARALLAELAPWMKVMDALSDIEYGRQGITDLPIASIRTAMDFRREDITCGCYFCCNPRGRYLNRLMDTPLPKIRLSGWLFYRHRFQCFCHWGYNYWYRSQSREIIDPYTVGDACAWPEWPYGDPFLVYPGTDGPVDSIRWEVFAESLQDYALLQTLGTRRESELLSVLESFEDFPRDEKWIEDARAELLGNT